MGVKRIGEERVFTPPNTRFSLVKTVDIVEGKRIVKMMVKDRDGVAILPIIGKDKIVMIRNYRPTVFGREKGKDDGYVLELPSGMIEPGENPLHAARRELLEETGYTAKGMRRLYGLYISPGLRTGLDTVFIATGLEKHAQHLMDDEQIQVIPMEMRRVIGLIKRNKIKDAESLAVITNWLCFNRRRK